MSYPKPPRGTLQALGPPPSPFGDGRERSWGWRVSRGRRMFSRENMGHFRRRWRRSRPRPGKNVSFLFFMLPRAAQKKILGYWASRTHLPPYGGDPGVCTTGHAEPPPSRIHLPPYGGGPVVCATGHTRPLPLGPTSPLTGEALGSVL